jgi:selenocysteine-specific elongation factor
VSNSLFVIGTAGHVDHGKSTLVRALTGIDPDRLAEEKAREMTIDLGFAWLKLPGLQDVSVIDVPGHEHFIKNMLAGVSGMDLVLLVVAANESIKPQTREHLAILDLMEVPRAIMVITQSDLADQDQIALVGMEIEDLIRPTRFAGSPVVAVSSVTGQGLPELKDIIKTVLSAALPRRDIGKPRLPIDRVFTIAGSGTVVTGTLIDGSLVVGQEVEALPAGLKSRIRGLQTHKAQLSVVRPGTRVAVNLVGLDSSDLKRGNVLTNPGWLLPTDILDARLRTLSQLSRPLQHNLEVSFHTGSVEAMARLRLLENEEVRPGDTTWVQFILDEPLAMTNNDHYIIRSPMDTLGGGIIIDSHPKRHPRFRSEIVENLKTRGEGKLEEMLLAALKAKQPQEQAKLLIQSNIAPEIAREALEYLIQQGKIISLGEGDKSLLFTDSVWKQITDDIAAMVQDFHRKYPLRIGISKAEIGSKLKIGPHFQEALKKLCIDGVLTEESSLVRSLDHVIRLTPFQQTQIDTFLAQLGRNLYSPSTDIVLETDLMNLLVEKGQIVKTGAGVVFSSEAYNQMLAKVTEQIKRNGRITLAEVRDMFFTSRKYAQALMENLDETKITRRVGDERVLFGQ